MLKILHILIRQPECTYGIFLSKEIISDIEKRSYSSEILRDFEEHITKHLNMKNFRWDDIYNKHFVDFYKRRYL